VTVRRSIADSPAQLWLLFGVHAFLTLFVALVIGDRTFAFTDVTAVYRGWVDDWANGAPLVGLQNDWVYPVGALVPILLPALAGPGYLLAWLLLVLGLDAWAFALLVRRSGRAAMFWVVLLLALGPVASGRLDSVATPLVTVAIFWLTERPRTAAALLAAATWIKVWPVAAVVAAVTVGPRRATVLVWVAITTAAVVGADALLGGAPHLFSFLAQQSNRGLQVEAPFAMTWLWLGASAALPVRTLFDPTMLDYEVKGPGVDAAVVAATPAMLIVVAGVLTLGSLALRSTGSSERVFPSLTLALVATLLVVNKVGSTQYAIWPAAPIALGLAIDHHRYRLPAVAALGSAILAQVTLFGPVYWALLHLYPGAILVVTLRNVGYVVLLGWSLVDLGTSTWKRRPVMLAGGSRAAIPVTER
jgi:hypothetical protein